MSYSVDSSDEDEYSGPELFSQNLLDCIDEVKAVGSFATGNVIQEFPNPGISVDGGEPITLPLSKEGARALANESRKAPFGKNGETLVDESVRKTWEIGADRISCQNPAWPSFVNKLVRLVARELGVPPAADGEVRIRAELYKNLLYEPGAMFKAHKDTEKVAGMFGTLVICLPSQHTGGTVCLRHGDECIRLSTEESSTFDCSYLAWYADVSHEIETVRTGYRWVLTYNLINDEPGSYRASASALNFQTEKLVQTLSWWYDCKESMPDFLVYPLQHQYTARYLGLAHLKGRDYQRARHVAASCARHGSFYLFLANVEVIRSWANDESLEDDADYNYARFLRNASTLEGIKLSEDDIRLAEECLLGGIGCPERDPDSRTGGEYMGNQYADFEETYLDKVMVIVPKHRVQAPLIGHRFSHWQLNTLVVRLRQTIGVDVHGEDHNNDTPMQNLLLQVCDNVLNIKADKSGQQAMDFCLGYIAVTAAFLGDASRFHRAVVQTHEAWACDSFLALGKIIDLQDPSVDEKDLITILTKGCTLGVCHRNLVQFHRGFCKHNPGGEDQAKTTYEKQWYTDRLVEVLRKTSAVAIRDASVLMDIILGDQIQPTPEQREILDKAVVGFLHRFNDDKGIANRLMVKCLLQLENPDSVRPLFFHHLLRILLEPTISAFDLNEYYHLLQLDYPDGCCIFQNGKRETRISYAGLIRSFYDWAAAYSEDAASRILWKIQRQASGAERATVKAILLPLIAELIPSVNIGSVEVQHCFQSLVKTYIIETVGQEPSKPRDWARPAEVNKDCSRLYPPGSPCGKCQQINSFLEDPNAQQLSIDLTHEKWHTEAYFNNLRFFLVEKEAQGNETRLRKTLRWWESRHQDWELEAGKATQALRGLPQDKLRVLLADQYDMLMALDCVRLEKDVAERGGGCQSPNGRAESAKPDKRPRGEEEDESESKSAVLPKRARRNEG